MDFSEKLNYLFELSHAEGQELAALMNVTPPQISKMRRSVRGPPKNRDAAYTLTRFFAQRCYSGFQLEALSKVVRIAQVKDLEGENVPNTSQYHFSHFVLCGNCGCTYRRKTTHGKVTWQCGTFLVDGKAACPARQIPEKTLIQCTLTALGTSALDPDDLHKRVRQIVVTARTASDTILLTGIRLSKHGKADRAARIGRTICGKPQDRE